MSQSESRISKTSIFDQSESKISKTSIFDQSEISILVPIGINGLFESMNNGFDNGMVLLIRGIDYFRARIYFRGIDFFSGNCIIFEPEDKVDYQKESKFDHVHNELEKWNVDHMKNLEYNNQLKFYNQLTDLFDDDSDSASLF